MPEATVGVARRAFAVPDRERKCTVTGVYTMIRASMCESGLSRIDRDAQLAALDVIASPNHHEPRGLSSNLESMSCSSMQGAPCAVKPTLEMLVTLPGRIGVGHTAPCISLPHGCTVHDGFLAARPCYEGK